MQNCCSILVALISLLAAAVSFPSQAAEQACVIVLTGQNQNRTVSGAVNSECKGDGTGAPWGNWGVSSNYGRKTDTDQFRGWKSVDGKRRWNSCTSLFPPPDCGRYNAAECTTQQSSSTATHGRMSYRTTFETCDSDAVGAPRPTYYGCQHQEGSVIQTSNHMTLYKLDREGDALIETLNFPGTSVTFTGCDQDGCPERTSGWVDMTPSPSSLTRVEADLQMKASAYLEGACDWNW